MAKSPISWLGGKSRLAKTIIAGAPAHECYAEVFAGAAWVLFSKPQERTEIINDINTDLVTLYRVLQYHLDEFMRFFRWALTSRGEFERLKAMRADTLTDIQRAARFYYIARTCFSGRATRPTLGTWTRGSSGLNLLRLEEQLSETHLRLAGVLVENLGYAEFIQRYDRPHTWFYIDPPYWNCETDYGKDIFSKDDFANLAAHMAAMKGKATLSINDAPEIRTEFSAFRIEQVDTKYSIGQNSSGKGMAVKELLIHNFDAKTPKMWQV